MLNQVILVGRVVSDLEINETENETGKKVLNLVLAVPRFFKNANGIYETDFIPCQLWNSIAENTAEYCKVGDIVGVRGRLQKTNTENMRVVAEKISFLSTRKGDE